MFDFLTNINCQNNRNRPYRTDDKTSGTFIDMVFFTTQTSVAGVIISIELFLRLELLSEQILWGFEKHKKSIVQNKNRPGNGEVYLRKEKVNKKSTTIRRASIHEVRLNHKPQLEGVKGQLPLGTNIKGNASS